MATVRLRVLATPINLCGSRSASKNAQIVDQRAPPLARERQRRRHAFAGRPGDRKRQVSFAAQAERRHARTVLHEQRRVHDAAHLGHVFHVVRMNDARVPEAVLGLLRPLDRLVHVAAANERHERHHLLDGHERVAHVRLAEQQLDLVARRSCRRPWPAPPRPAPENPWPARRACARLRRPE